MNCDAAGSAEEQQRWLAKLSALHFDPAKKSRKDQGNAPHKPLLLLIVVELVEQGRLGGAVLQRNGDLAFRFSSYWTIVGERRRTKPDLRLPFYHLKRDGFWMPLNARGTPASSREDAVLAQIEMPFLICLADPVFRLAARRTLIARYFEPAERAELYALFQMETPPDDVIAADARRYLPSDHDERRRDTKFAVGVLTAYDFTCALSGYRMVDTRGNTVLEAAHIHQFKRGGPCHPTNGLALTRTAHWLFDYGYWSLTDECVVLVAEERFDERFDERGDVSLLLKHRAGKPIAPPRNAHTRPDPTFLRWHREKVFEPKRGT